MKFRVVMNTKADKTWYTLQYKHFLLWYILQDEVGDVGNGIPRYVDVTFDTIVEAEARAKEIAAEYAEVVSIALNEFEL